MVAKKKEINTKEELRAHVNEIKKKISMVTAQAAPSGMGTDMHSKSGINTINFYKIFQNVDHNATVGSETEKLRREAILKALTLVEKEAKEWGLNLNLEEARRAQEAKIAETVTAQPKEPREAKDAKEAKNEPQEETLEALIEQGKIVFGHKKQATEIKPKVGQSYSFNAVKRDDPALLKKFEGQSLAPGPAAYNPKHAFVY